MKKALSGLLILCLLLSSLSLFVGCGASGEVVYEEADTYSVGSARVEDKITAVEIYWVSGSVTLKGALTTKTVIWEDYHYESNNTLRYRVKDGVLQVYPSASGVKDADKVKKNLEVELPLDLANALERVEIKTEGNTPVTVEMLKTKKLSVNTAAGSIDVDSQLKTANFITKSGNLKVSSIGADSLSFASKTGSAELALHLYGFTAVMENKKGSFESGYECYRNGNIYTYGTQETSLRLSTAGKVTLNDVE